MKKILILFAALNLILMIALAGLFVLSEIYPLRPGAAFYDVQHTAEQWRLRLASGKVRPAVFALDLAERRLADLASARGEEQMQAALVTFDQALNEAVRRLGAAPAAVQDGLRDRLETLLGRAEVVVTALEPADGDTAVIVLGRKIRAMQEAETTEEIVTLVPQATLSKAEPIPFLGQEVDHSVYPLTGEHAELNCEACHEEGQYADTPTGCGDCHEIPFDYYYADHFAGDCDECHVTDNWTPFQFEHVDVVECQSCHEDQAPADHYVRSPQYWWLVAQFSDSGVHPFGGYASAALQTDACASCHPSTSDWEDATFDHFGFTDCESCHQGEAPDDHAVYKGTCVECHNTGTWDVVTYEHADVVECRSCHLPDSPPDHYVRPDGYVLYVTWSPDSFAAQRGRPSSVQPCPDTCANCHGNTLEWTGVTFDHTGYADCQSCHLADDTPEGHYAGQCSNCHDVYNWERVVFDHTGSADCQDCHQLEDEHYAGQCSDCHGINDWKEVVFDHTRFADCVECHAEEAESDHYAGQCSGCHTTDDWGQISFDHTDFPQCADCHGQENHYHLRCDSCHNTSDWGEYWFNHAGYNRCADCHRDEAGPGHYDAPCGNCHVTSGWQVVTYDHSSLLDCQSCHIPPSDHFGSPCTRCHNASNWQSVDFDHSGLVDCQSCHAPPAGHDYPGQCSECHSTDSWQVVRFSHEGLADCEFCHAPPDNHYAGACANCHNTNNWGDAVFSHDGLLDCESCHEPPAGHWPGQCSDCHGMSGWGDYVFNHTGYTNCKACHSQERPISHSRGQCSRCHTTESWDVLAPTATPILPTPTNTPIPPGLTHTPIPPGPTNTPIPPGPTNTPIPPAPTNTPVPPTPTNTPVPPAPTNTSIPPEPTSTPFLRDPISTPIPPEPTQSFVAPGAGAMVTP